MGVYPLSARQRHSNVDNEDERLDEPQLHALSGSLQRGERYQLVRQTLVSTRQTSLLFGILTVTSV